MKKLFKSFLVGGLSIAAASALFAGVGSAKDITEVFASGGTLEWHTFYVALDDSYVASKGYTNCSVKSNVNTGNGGHGWQSNVGEIISDDRYAGYTVYELQYAEDYGGYNDFQIQILSNSTWAEQKVIYAGNWDSTSYENQIYFYEGTKSGTWEAYTPLVSWDIHGYAVLDGVLDTSVDYIDKTVRGGTSYNAPGRPDVGNLKHFSGWYKDIGCTQGQEFTSDTVNNNLTIYAKITTMTLDSYFYWIDKDSSDLAGGTVHFFGEYTNDWNNGLSIASCKVSDVLLLEGQGKLYKIPVPSIGNYQVILHNGNVQTFDMTITQHAVIYTKFDNTGGNGISYYSYNVNTNAGLAADLLVDVETVRTNVSASGDIGSMSLCGVLPSEAARLYGIYEGFTGELAGVKTMVDKSYTFTYNPNAKNDLDSEHEQNVTFDKIMEQLYEIAMRDATFASEHPASNRIISMFDNDSNINASVLIIIICASVLAVGATFVLRRKEN